MERKDTYFYRNQVLDLHLIVEDAIHTLLQMSFQVSLPVNSFKSSQARLDLLIDIGIIDKGFARSFQLFSEVRNCFVHRLGCYDFTHLPEDLKRKLLAYSNKSTDLEMENEALFIAFKDLHEVLTIDFLPKIINAMNHGQGSKAELQRMQVNLEKLIFYICHKYPEESKDTLMSFFN